MNQDKKKLLVIEDDLGLQKQLRWNFDAYETAKSLGKSCR